jgi:hypothetical protein
MEVSWLAKVGVRFDPGHEAMPGFFMPSYQLSMALRATLAA